MTGRRVIVAVACLVGVHLAVACFAQDESVSHRPTLAERLQRFRHELLGGGSDRDEQPPADPRNSPSNARASAKAMGGRPVMVKTPSPQQQPTVADAPPFTQPQSSRLVKPQRMQLQSARRAKTGAPPVTVITPNGQQDASIGPLDRPVFEARRRALGEPTEVVSEGVEEIDEVTPSPVDENSVDAVEVEIAEELPADVPTAAEPSSTNSEEPHDWQHYGESDDATPIESAPAESKESNGFPASNRLRPASPEPVVETTPEPEAVEELTPPAETEEENVLFTTTSPVLAVVASGPRTVMIGREAEFLVRVTNTGATANNVVVKVIVPHYADIASTQTSAGMAQTAARADLNSGLEWTLDRLETDAEQTLTLKLIPRKSSPLDLAVSYSFTPETSQTMVEVQEPKLAMSISGPSEVLFGQTKVFKLTISNPGNGDTHNVSVGLLPIGRGGEAQGTHRLGDLAAGESKSIDIELTARQAGSLAIRAQSFADGGLRAEAAQEVLVRRAELQVKVEAPRVKYAGTPATYQIIVQNTGDALADGVQLSAILPRDAKFLAASGGRLDPHQGRVSWVVGALPAGGERLFELQCALNSPGENQIQVAVDGGNELTASTTASTQVEAIADLKLEVRDPQGPVAVGDEAIYEVRIRNRGTKAAEGVDLALFFSSGLEPNNADGGPHDIGTGQVIFQPLASIGAGDTAVFHVRARADQPGNHVFRAEVNCPSLDVKLAAEEATHFYGDQRTAALPKREPTLAKPPQELEKPQALEEDAPPANPYE